MWYSPKSIGAVSAEPVTLATGKTQCRLTAVDTSFDDEITRLITVARDHVEKRTGMRYAERSITIECDSFSDFASRLPEAPLKTVTSVTYTDAEGASQTLADTIYQPAGNRFSPTIELKPDQSWPEVAPASRIELVATFGGDVPPEVVQAMLMLIAHWFNVKEAVNVGNIVTEVPMAVDALLTTEQRGIYT
jgi:uncharacterized phiE125 gp8 family phage protein